MVQIVVYVGNTENIKFWIFALFFFRLPHRFYGCRGSPHAHWTPPGPSKPTKPPKIDFSPWGGGGRPINALLTRVGIDP